MTAVAISEAEWQEQVLDLARATGWRTMHVRRSIGKKRQWTTATSVVGWPDLVMWNERQRRLLFVELKSDSGLLSDHQDDVLCSLQAAGCEVHVWRPRDLDDVQKALTHRRAA